MRRPLAIAVVLAGLVLPSSLDAQPRSASRSFASGPRMATGFAPFRSASGPIRTGMMRPAPSRGWRPGYGVAPHPVFPNGSPGSRRPNHPSYAGSSFRREFYPSGWFSFAQPMFVPYLWDSSAESQPEEQPTANEAEQDDALVSQVQSLTDEVESLREEQASRQGLNPYAATPQAAVQEKPAPTILVYRDGHQGEVQNYAIQGQTLWVFADQTTRRISLADLDLQATKKLNDERGVDFISPDMP